MLTLQAQQQHQQTPANMDHFLYDTLSRCLAIDPNTRMAAELQLKEMAKKSSGKKRKSLKTTHYNDSNSISNLNILILLDFPRSLIAIALTQDASIAHRQLAAFALKNYIDCHWSSKSEKFIGPEPHEQTKSIVRGLLLSGLGDASPKIRNAIAYCVSKVAHTDWPETWPNLLDELLVNLKSGDGNRVHGAMRVLTEFVRDDLSDQHLPYVAPVLFPELYRIFVSDSMSVSTRARALVIFRDFIEMLYMVKDENPDVVTNYLEPLLPTWLTAFKDVLSKPIVSTSQPMMVLNEILRTLNKLMNAFPKAVSPYLLHFLQIVWSHLVSLRDQYIRQFVSGDVENDDNAEQNAGEGESGASLVQDDCEQDSDGDSNGFDTFLYLLFEFVAFSARKRPLKAFFTGKESSMGKSANVGKDSSNNAEGLHFLKELAYMVIVYMQMTQDQEENWLTDINQFVQDEEEESYSYSVRIAADDMLTTLSDLYTEEMVSSVLAAVQRHLEESNAFKAQTLGNLHAVGPTGVWWKLEEVCLLVLGNLSHDISKLLSAQIVQFDLAGLFQHVVLNAMRQVELPFLQGRAIWFASRFAQHLPAALTEQYLSAAVEALRTPHAKMPVRISALKALRAFCSTTNKAQLATYQAAIIEGIVSIANDVSEDALILALETLSVAIKINEQVTGSYESILGPLLLATWVKYTEDVLIQSIVQELFDVLAGNAFFAPTFTERVFPHLLEAITLTNQDKEPGIVSGAIDYFTALIKRSPEPLNPMFVTQMFPALMHLLLTTDDHSILQNGQDCVKFLVMKDVKSIAGMSIPLPEGGSKTGLDLVIQFVAKLLHPNQSESASLFVGELITKLITKGGDVLQPVLPDLLRAVAERLESAKTSTFIQSLVIVFAQLLQTHMDTVIEFLSGLTIHGKNGLSIFVNAWCENFEYFQGYYTLKVSAVSMSKLFMNPDPRLKAIMVKGDLIVRNTGRIMTRSRTQRGETTFILELEREDTFH